MIGRERPSQRGGVFVFAPRSAAPMPDQNGAEHLSSAIVPTYARADLAFERGEGCWLTTTNGERYLDFGAGIAVNVARPCASASRRGADRAGRKALAHLQPVPDARRASGSRGGCADATFADLVFFANSGAEANEAAIKMARKYHVVAGHPERYRILTFEGAFHGRTLATLAAGGQAKYLEGFGPKVDGFDQIPITDLDAVEAAIGPADRGDPDRADPGRGRRARRRRRVPAGLARDLRRARPAADLRRGADRHGPHRQAVRLRAHRRRARHHDLGQGPRRRLPDRRVPRDRRRRQGPDRRHRTARPSAAIRWRWRSATPCSTSCWRRASSTMSRGSGCCARQKLAELKDAHPDVIEEVRGEGLMIGLKLQDAARRLRRAARASSRLLTIPAGDNVVRLLPPLIDQRSGTRRGRAPARRAPARDAEATLASAKAAAA